VRHVYWAPKGDGVDIVEVSLLKSATYGWNRKGIEELVSDLNAFHVLIRGRFQALYTQQHPNGILFQPHYLLLTRFMTASVSE
jgi:hypothetical protein